MRVNLKNTSETIDSNRKYVSKIRNCICQLSLWNIFRLLIFCVTCFLVLFFSRAYTKEVLIWLEKQDTVLLYSVIMTMLILVSFPFCVGYIAIVGTTGYLYGFTIGLPLSIFGANVGILVAHNAMKLIKQHSFFNTLTTNTTTSAIIRVISGNSSFKIVFCARLTPIPFGLQNCIFAFTEVSGPVYHLASFVGLLPGQIVSVYAGSSLRSIQDVLDSQQISLFTYLMAAVQLIFATCLLVWLGTRARRELRLVISQAESKLNSNDAKMTNFSTTLNIV